MSVYTKPKFEFNHLEQPMDPNIAKLQVVQNDLLRLIEGKKKSRPHKHEKAERRAENIFS